LVHDKFAHIPGGEGEDETGKKPVGQRVTFMVKAQAAGRAKMFIVFLTP
jgi:hypothetical protein